MLKKYITILLSSHNQDDIGFLFDEIIHLKEGKLES